MVGESPGVKKGVEAFGPDPDLPYAALLQPGFERPDRIPAS